MIFLVGSNLAVIVIAIIAASMFSSLAREKGYVASQARKYVIIVAFASLFLMMMGQSVISLLANLMQSKGSFGHILIYCWSGFILVLCVTVLYKAYQNMKKAPNAGASAEQPTVEEI